MMAAAATRMQAATRLVQIAFSRSAGAAGAPGSVPALTSPASIWLRAPMGSTAKSVVHQITKNSAVPPPSVSPKPQTATAIARIPSATTTPRVVQNEWARNRTAAIGGSLSRLLEFDEGPVEVLRVKEQDRLAMGPG